MTHPDVDPYDQPEPLTGRDWALALLVAVLAIGALLFGSTAFAQSAPAALRIGYQKGSIALVLAKEHGLLEKQFPQTKVQWIEFPAEIGRAHV